MSNPRQPLLLGYRQAQRLLFWLPNLITKNRYKTLLLWVEGLPGAPREDAITDREQQLGGTKQAGSSGETTTRLL